MNSLLTRGFPDLNLNPDDVRRGAIRVLAHSPSGATYPLEVKDGDGVYTTNFTPSQSGHVYLFINYLINYLNKFRKTLILKFRDLICKCPNAGSNQPSQQKK